MSEPARHPRVCVLVTVDCAPADLPDLADHARVGIERFPEWPGFLYGALQVDARRGRLVQYLQWASEREYRAAVDDPVWSDLPSAQAFLAAVGAGRAAMDIGIYDIVTATDGNAP